MKNRALPRVVVAALSGGSGKSLVSMALLRAFREAGQNVAAFKKGPDYIDAAWLTWISAGPARNLDTYLMGFDGAVASFATHGADGLNVIEGNRGLFDGMDAAGTHSTAALARALCSPVLLVLNTTKMTRSAAALVLGAQKLEPELNIAGVILNFVNGRRHEHVLRESITRICGVPIVGVLPRMDPDDGLPERHLGLVTPEDCPTKERIDHCLRDTVIPGLDLQSIARIAASAAPLASPPEAPVAGPDRSQLKIAYIKDAAFSFYYPENLEALERAGAQLVPISALTSRELPAGISALYIGGGFPEVHAPALAGNTSFLRSLSEAARGGLPIYAECGGLMLLSQAIIWHGERHAMAGVLPVETLVSTAAQGHGYVELSVDRPNPFFPVGLSLRGHEFHYSRIELNAANLDTACEVRRGTGAWQRRDAIVTANLWAAYTHLHALATPEWATGLVSAARRYAAHAIAAARG
ncbi:MAG: cobyrinate a,c-diamide synthase [Terriglobales bacterium]